MKIFKQRDYSLNEETDWHRNVQPAISKQSESVPVYNADGSIGGWNIQHQYE